MTLNPTHLVVARPSGLENSSNNATRPDPSLPKKPSKRKKARKTKRTAVTQKPVDKLRSPEDDDVPLPKHERSLCKVLMTMTPGW
jgi:hypothetical protein